MNHPKWAHVAIGAIAAMVITCIGATLHDDLMTYAGCVAAEAFMLAYLVMYVRFVRACREIERSIYGNR